MMAVRRDWQSVSSGYGLAAGVPVHPRTGWLLGFSVQPDWNGLGISDC